MLSLAFNFEAICNLADAFSVNSISISLRILTESVLCLFEDRVMAWISLQLHPKSRLRNASAMKLTFHRLHYLHHHRTTILTRYNLNLVPTGLVPAGLMILYLGLHLH